MTLMRAREALRDAIDRACIARGEMLWTNGYRTGAAAGNDERLYEKERAQLKACAKTEASVERAIRAYARAIKATK